MDIDYAIRKLRQVLDEQKNNPDPDYLDIITHRDEVLNRFQPIFQPTHIPILTEEEFNSFLPYNNNHHWALQRAGTPIAKDIQLLRKALTILLDESAHISVRVNRLRLNYQSASNSMVPNLGIPYITGILLFAHPDKYGVWNKTTMEGMEKVGLWEAKWLEETTGKTYLRMLNIFNQLTSALNIDLWTLDALWWVVKKEITN